MVVIFVDLLRRALWRLGPYAFVEIVLPGGTLIAALLYFYRRASVSDPPAVPRHTRGLPTAERRP